MRLVLVGATECVSQKRRAIRLELVPQQCKHVFQTAVHMTSTSLWERILLLWHGHPVHLSFQYGIQFNVREGTSNSGQNQSSLSEPLSFGIICPYRKRLAGNNKRTLVRKKNKSLWQGTENMYSIVKVKGTRDEAELFRPETSATSTLCVLEVIRTKWGNCGQQN